MKIAVIGYSGSGKSTLAQRLGERYGVPVLHLDTVRFLPGWQVCDRESQRELVRNFMDRNAEWIIEALL